MDALTISRHLSALLQSNDERKYGEKRALIGFLAHYFKLLAVETRDENIIPHIPQHVLAAMEELRESDSKLAKRTREQYIVHSGGTSIPALTEVSYLTSQRAVTVLWLGMIMEEATDLRYADMSERVMRQFLAQDDALITQAQLFLYRVGKEGFLHLVMNNEAPCHESFVGRTGLRTSREIVDGQEFLDITFYREHPEREREESLKVRYVIGQPITVVLQGVDTEFPIALDMIRDVMDNWPRDSDQQRELVSPANHITFH